MKVILTKDNVVKDVSEGYAQNYLIPKGLAIIATPQEISKRDQQLKNLEKERKEQEKRDQEKISTLENQKFQFTSQKVGSNNKLFGSITTKEIADLAGLKKENIILAKPVSETGEHKIPIKIGAFHSQIILVVTGKKD
jgi:large subunit ribosomal protein L9